MIQDQKFAYLKRYANQKKEHYNISENCFWSLDNIEEIIESEKRLGFEFPQALKAFWRNIGYGYLESTDPKLGKLTMDHHNKIIRPKEIADILLLKEESGLILPEAVEYMDPDEMPFFEIGDMSSFLYMKPLSSNPNAVWGYGEIIEEDFEKFIWRLYYESPTYYLDRNK